jgi:hypothetical protein
MGADTLAFAAQRSRNWEVTAEPSQTATRSAWINLIKKRQQRTKGRFL